MRVGARVQVQVWERHVIGRRSFRVLRGLESVIERIMLKQPAQKGMWGKGGTGTGTGTGSLSKDAELGLLV